MDISIFPRNENRNTTSTLQQDTVYFPGAFVSPNFFFSAFQEASGIMCCSPDWSPFTPLQHTSLQKSMVHKALTHKEALPKLRNQWCS